MAVNKSDAQAFLDELAEIVKRADGMEKKYNLGARVCLQAVFVPGVKELFDAVGVEYESVEADGMIHIMGEYESVSIFDCYEKECK